MNIARRTALAASAAAVVCAAVAHAETYPAQVIRVLHGFGPGGNADTVARLLGAELSKPLGQPIIVEPKPGAGGVLAADTVAKAKSDGYTLLLATGGHAISPAMYGKLPYDAVKSFQPVAAVSTFPFLIVVNAQGKFHTIKDLLAAASAKPGMVTYGSAGIGTGQHLSGALMAQMAGVQMNHIPYKGESAAVSAVLGAEVDFVVLAPTAAVSHIKAGKLRALGTSGSTRWPGLPDVPTVAEQGVPRYEVKSWTALLAPAGTPASVVKRLNTEVNAVLARPDIRARIEETTGGETSTATPDELRARIDADVKRWVQLVADAKISKE